MSIEEFRNKEVHAERVKSLAKQYVVVTSFQRTFTEDWGSSNEYNYFSKTKNFEQWNYGECQRGILPSIKKSIISYEKAARSSFNYSFAHHPQARLL